ncbi:hypothetical protein [Marinimicrobium alkaliphilum]|uniref:hypothetical protein n=1 Tax=Marinimicrobium alkaliphilum TaxID=2202654 RepID=UPI000DBA9918|nr:hypothetical protein [Marinimicrobium alkaliphilum]
MYKRLMGPLLLALTPLTASASGGHFLVDDASIVPRGTCELELWATRSSPTTWGTLSPGCNFMGAEWSMPLVYNFQSDEFDSVSIERKAMLYRPLRGPAIAFSLGAEYSLSRDGLDAVYANVPVSFHLSESVVLHLNGGVEHNRVLEDTYLTYGAALNIRLAGPRLIAEVYNEEEGDPIVAAGLRYHIGSTSWTLDLGVAHDTGPGDNHYTLGLNIPSLF